MCSRALIVGLVSLAAECEFVSLGSACILSTLDPDVEQLNSGFEGYSANEERARHMHSATRTTEV